MKRHFEQELESLKTMLVKMASLAEANLATGLRGLIEQKAELAEGVLAAEERINSLEIEIDNAIIDILALYQPVASDLRMIIAAQKINNDLERIGDHAVNISESVLSILKRKPAGMLLELPQMARLAKEMLRDALDSFIHLNAAMAHLVLQRDDQMDDLNRTMALEVVQKIKSEPDFLEEGLDLIRVSKNLERVADLATNIAEEVIFISQARIVKHHADDLPKKSHPKK